MGQSTPMPLLTVTKSCFILTCDVMNMLSSVRSKYRKEYVGQIKWHEYVCVQLKELLINIPNYYVFVTVLSKIVSHAHNMPLFLIMYIIL